MIQTLMINNVLVPICQHEGELYIDPFTFYRAAFDEDLSHEAVDVEGSPERIDGITMIDVDYLQDVEDYEFSTRDLEDFVNLVSSSEGFLSLDNNLQPIAQPQTRGGSIKYLEDDIHFTDRGFINIREFYWAVLKIALVDSHIRSVAIRSYEENPDSILYVDKEFYISAASLKNSFTEEPGRETLCRIVDNLVEHYQEGIQEVGFLG